MKTNTTKKSYLKKIIIIGAAVVVLLGVGYGVFAYMNKDSSLIQSETTDANKTSDDVNYDEPTDEQKQAGDAQKESTVSPNQSDPGDEPDNNTLKVTLSVFQNGSIVQIRSFINKISNTGSCTLSLQKGNEKIVKTAGLQALPNESTCKGFDVSTNELSMGEWQVIVSVESGLMKGDAKTTFAVQ